MPGADEEDFLTICADGQYERVKEEISKDVQLLYAKSSRSGMDCLMFAAREGHAELTTFLVSRGSSMRNRDHDRRWTALMWAVSGRHDNVVRILKQADPEGLDEALRDASSKKDGVLVGLTLAYGANPNAKGMGGVTALMLAAMYNHVGIVLDLLSHDAQPDIRNVDGLTALSLASRFDHLETATALLGAVEDVNARDRIDGDTSLHIAIENGRNVATLLIERGADVNALSGEGLTPLMIAARKGDLEMCRRLVEAGADARAESVWGDRVVNALDVVEWIERSRGLERADIRHWILSQGVTPTRRERPFLVRHTTTCAQVALILALATLLIWLSRVWATNEKNRARSRSRKHI